MAKVLIVLDNSYRFSEATGTPDFTYTVLVGALEDAGHEVTRAHREVDGSAQISNFNFKTSVNLMDFDVVWLIGKSGRNEFNSTIDSGKGLGDDADPAMVEQLTALAEYMAAGGGVFATGDHDSIGSEMCGHVPRVRAMRAWYGTDDGASPMPAGFPRNYPRSSAGRADTTQRSGKADYGGDANLVWFENQSDSTPQTITPKSPTHPILRRGDQDIKVFPDHMHEGKVLGDLGGDYDYTQSIPIGAKSFVEFPLVAGNRELPRIIASGKTTQYTNKYVSGATIDSNTEQAGVKDVDTFSVYDGRLAGVGRIVTGSTFHHYVDINLTGDSGVDATDAMKSGADTRKNEGFAYAMPSVPGAFEDIKAVFVNITNWLARPKPKITIILERSNFSQAEANANSQFDNVILVTVDGLKPSQFPDGPLDDLTPSMTDLGKWAPKLSFAEPAGLTIAPIGVDSDDPSLPARLQRFTFRYGLTIDAATAFAFAEDINTVRIDASLGALEVSAALTDRAWIQLVKSSNPFSLDLANNNKTPWLSSDLKIFPVVAGASKVGKTLPNNATRADALVFLKDVVDDITIAQFEGLPSGQSESALSPLPTTTGGGNKKVYNFALARVRVNPADADAGNVRVFFRIVPSPTTAALTYRESGGIPTGTYKKTPGAAPIPLPGTNGAGTEWVSFPVFAEPREVDPEDQDNAGNIKDVDAGQSVIFGALIDNNLNDPYLPAKPTGGASQSVRDLMMGEHQCIVAQIEFPGTPIPDGATPYTSDKLAQRNIAFSEIANPGLDASRMALHTFEIEAAAHGISEASPPDELLLEWASPPPDGTEVSIYVSGWQAAEVIALADRFYPRHDIRQIDTRTLALPGGGTRYVPLPTSQQRWTGVLIVQFPLGVKQGQRFDLTVRQITTRRRMVDVPPKVTAIPREAAARLLASGKAGAKVAKAETALPIGVFDLGDNHSLVTDMRVFDAPNDHAVIIEHPDREQLAAARRQSGVWRETIGAFQLGIPVSVKGAMLGYHIRLLSMMRWRADKLRPNDRWYDSFRHYVVLLADKVRALGGDPFAVPATPDGSVDVPGQGIAGGGDVGSVSTDDPKNPTFEPGADDWLGGTDGLASAGETRPGLWSGKVSGLLFDHFGDFEGFFLEDYAGGQHRFFSREAAIRDLAETAWQERYVVTAITVSADSRRIRRLLIRGYPD